MKVILASASPRRRELLREIVADFDVLSTDADESLPVGIAPDAAVEILARRKAESGRESAFNAGMVGENEEFAIVGADTVVAFEGKILGKPKDENEAYEMLATLSGNTHEVYTGVCFITNKRTVTQSVRSTVTFKNLTHREILDYIATGSPMDKAGAYGIQDGNIVQSFAGSYANVVGLPVEKCKEIYQEIAKR